MRDWETFDGEVDEPRSYRVWKRRELDRLTAHRVGKHHNDEARQNMSKAQRKRRNRAG